MILGGGETGTIVTALPSQSVNTRGVSFAGPETIAS